MVASSLEASPESWSHHPWAHTAARTGEVDPGEVDLGPEAGLSASRVCVVLVRHPGSLTESQDGIVAERSTWYGHLCVSPRLRRRCRLASSFRRSVPTARSKLPAPRMMQSTRTSTTTNYQQFRWLLKTN